jgi:DNA polymerase II small subunit
MTESKHKEIVNFFLGNDILVSPDVIQQIEDPEKIQELITSKIGSEGFLFLNKDIDRLLGSKSNIEANWLDFERIRTQAEKQNSTLSYGRFLEFLNNDESGRQVEKPLVEVVGAYQKEPQRIDVQHFVSHFNERYKAMERFLSQRMELTNLMSINRILGKRERENVSMIGLVQDKQITKNGNIMLNLEDPTGKIKVLINKTKPNLYEFGQDIVLDEVIGLNGVNSDKIVFANAVVLPDIPNDKTLKKCPDDAYAVFLSDLHVGSTYFLRGGFMKFLDWINCRSGSEEQQAIAKKVKYIIIAGDLVDGVGVYPRQEKELVTLDIFEQYEQCAELLKQIPSHIPLIICPGNHDAMRLSEPQLELYKDFSEAIWELPNAIMVSNPANVTIHKTKGFKGFDVLMYHGYSFDYYVPNVNSIRIAGGYERPDLIMKFLLQRRHLAPSHSSTLYMPDPEKDSLVIERVPDFFVTGHIHYSSVAHYRNVTMICGSCWQARTSFQEKMGHKPQPCRVPIVDLKTRNVKILKFGD